jgi:hypothetical protein
VRLWNAIAQPLSRHQAAFSGRNRSRPTVERCRHRFESNSRRKASHPASLPSLKRLCKSIEALISSELPKKKRQGLDIMTDRIDANWVKVGTYPNAFSANSASALLTSIKIPNRLQSYGTVQILEWYIWVPREFEADASEALNASISDEELTAEALRDPPPR